MKDEYKTIQLINRQKILGYFVLLMVLMWFSSSIIEPQTVHASNGVYIVQHGDTLTGIAQRHGLRVSQLASTNGLYWNSWVYVGQRLTIPGQVTSPIQPSPSSGVYIVKYGDSLSKIAHLYGVSVWALQNANNLWNPNLIYVGQRLIIHDGGSAPAPTPAPAPIPSSTPPTGGNTGGYKWIDINLSSQTLTAYQGNTAIFWSTVSTGKWGTPTVVGTYSIYTKYRYDHMQGGYGANYYNLPNVPYVMYFYRGYALHGTYWHTNFGTPQSHGCVNLTISDAGWLYNWAPVGTKVVAHY